MLALIEEIKNAVILLGNDSQPEDIQMRACMGLAIELMKELRNTFLESGYYSELVTSRASQALAECRTQLGCLYRRVPCCADGCPVTAEVKNYFLQVMNGVVVDFEYLIDESSSNRYSRAPNSQNGHRNLMLFKKLTWKKQFSQLRRKNELDPRDYLEADLREAELEVEKTRAEYEQLKSSLTALKSEYRALRSDMNRSSPKRSSLIGKFRAKMSHSHHSRSQISGCKSKWSLAETLPLPEKDESKDKSTTSSELILKDLSELSIVPMVGSYPNIGSKDLEVLWVQEDQQKFQPQCTSSEFRFNVITQLESKSNLIMVGSFQNIESRSSLRMQSSQDLQVIWVQKGKSSMQTSSTSSDFILKHLPQHLEELNTNTSLTTESQPDLQVLWVRTEKPMNMSFSSSHIRFMDMPQNDGSATNFKIDNVPIEQATNQTVSNFSDLLVDELPQAEKFENQTSLTTESPQDLQLAQIISSSSNFLLRELLKPDKFESQSSLTTESPQDLQLAQIGSSSSNFLLRELLKPDKFESQSSLTTESPQDLKLAQIGSSSSNFLLRELLKPDKFESQSTLTTESPQDLQLAQIGSSSSNFLLRELLKPDKFESQSSLTTESPQDLQLAQIGSSSSNFLLRELLKPDIFESQSLTSLTTDSPIVRTGSTPADFILNNLTKPDVTLVVSIENIASPMSLRMESGQDLGDTPQPQIDQSQSISMIKTPENVQVWRSQMNKHMSQTSFTSNDFILKNLKELESNMALADSISNIQINSSLWRLSQQDLPVLKDKPSIRTSSNYSDFLLKDLLYPEKVETKTCLIIKSSPQLQLLLASTDKPMADSIPSSADLSVKKRNAWTKSRQIGKPKTPIIVTMKNLNLAKIPSANTSQLPMTKQKSNRQLEAEKLKPTKSYFSVGKTFGDHRLRLLRWCQEKTKEYGVPMYEFSESWRSGLALVAIIYSYRKDLIEDRFNPSRPTKQSPRDVLICGAKAAKSLGLNSKVDIVRVCQQRVPDFCKVFTFVSELHRCLEQKLE